MNLLKMKVNLISFNSFLPYLFTQLYSSLTRSKELAKIFSITLLISLGLRSSEFRSTVNAVLH